MPMKLGQGGSKGRDRMTARHTRARCKQSHRNAWALFIKAREFVPIKRCHKNQNAVTAGKKREQPNRYGRAQWKEKEQRHRVLGEPGVGVHTSNLSILEAEAGKIRRSRAAWAT